MNKNLVSHIRHISPRHARDLSRWRFSRWNSILKIRLLCWFACGRRTKKWRGKNTRLLFSWRHARENYFCFVLLAQNKKYLFAPRCARKENERVFSGKKKERILVYFNFILGSLSPSDTRTLCLFAHSWTLSLSLTLSSLLFALSLSLFFSIELSLLHRFHLNLRESRNVIVTPTDVHHMCGLTFPHPSVFQPSFFVRQVSRLRKIPLSFSQSCFRTATGSFCFTFYIETNLRGKLVSSSIRCSRKGICE